MKVFMVTDMEGVAGVVSFSQQSFPDGKYYDEAKKLETAEVNAAVDGLLDAGVTDVLVVTSSVGMLHRVHGHTTRTGLDTSPTVGTSLTDRLQRVIRVRNCTNGSHTSV